MIPITEFIQDLRDSFGGSDIVYTNGSCYKLAKLLVKLYPKAELVYHKRLDHAAVRYDNDKIYDITGEVTEYLERYRPPTKDEVRIMEDYLFDLNNPNSIEMFFYNPPEEKKSSKLK